MLPTFRVPWSLLVVRSGSVRHAARTLRTVLIATSYPCHRQDPAGHFVRAEALSLCARGHEVHVICPDGTEGGVVADSGIETWPVAHGGAFGWPGAASRIARRPWRLAGAATFAALASNKLRDLRPERIIAHWLVPCAHPIAISCREARDIRAVAHGADIRLLVSLPPLVRAHLVTQLVSRCSQIRFVARSSLFTLARTLPRSLSETLHRKAIVRSVCLTVPSISTRAKEIRHSIQGPLAVCVSRLVPSKRVELAIAAVERVVPACSLSVIGQGPEHGKLRQFAGPAVRFEGLLSRSHALAWIAAADVLVHTSMAEAAPTVVREARQLRTRVVACDAGDIGDWAKDDNGIEIVEARVEAIAAAMSRAVSASSTRHRQARV